MQHLSQVVCKKKFVLSICCFENNLFSPKYGGVKVCTTRESNRVTRMGILYDTTTPVVPMAFKFMNLVFYTIILNYSD